MVLNRRFKTAKAKLEKSMKPILKYSDFVIDLIVHDTSFTEYDDVVIHRVIESIKVFKNEIIKVITKFVAEITEPV